MHFSKYQGTGNDFILVEESLPPDQIKQLCDRRYGVGADGLILMSDGGESDARITIYNADGNVAEMCGNGLRCVACYLRDQGLTKKCLTIQTDHKRYTAHVEGEVISIDMGKAEIIEKGCMLNGLSYDLIDTGVPHLVHFCEEMKQGDFTELAKGLRNHSHFSPSGVNVNFVKLLPSRALCVRTYERGVEDETFSCGTGAAAACVAAWSRFGIRGVIEVTFHSGESLQFDLLASDDLLQGIEMKGQAKRVFQGQI